VIRKEQKAGAGGHAVILPRVVLILLAAFSFMLILALAGAYWSGAKGNAVPAVPQNPAAVQTGGNEAAADAKKPPVSAPGTSAAILPELASLYAQNPDIAGWLTIDGTGIDYPVMFTPEDGEYYLHRDFNGKADKNGSLFIQKDCDPFTPGTNIIIHGHNMKSGKMFAPLLKYMDKAYFNEHPAIRFDTLYQKGEYEILAVFLSKVYKKSDKVFKFYEFTQADGKDRFDDFIGNVKKLALYDTGVTAGFGDQLITLSTCEYTDENGRLVVVAKKVLPK
jgi:sortase B